ncbi:hypothetical protein [Lysobacter capsici]|uniref:hypothetical protein n=1 Tax=Lysobacter capsici TaxID=435897 RepID=UPI00044C3EFA|nr:hypothetical protein [Lysobacter capsici]
MNNQKSGAKSDETEQPLRTLTSLSSILATLLAIATLVGFCLHLIGHVAHATYLEALGLDSDLFSQASEWKILLGYQAIILLGTDLLAALPWEGAVIIFLSVTVAIWLSRVPVKREAPLRAWLKRRRRWIQELIMSSIASGLALAFVGAIGVAMLVLGILPVGIGVSAGKGMANKARARIASKTLERRSELWRGDKREARGYIVSANDTLIAIYDIDTSVLRTISQEGIEIRTGLLLPETTGTQTSPAP